MLVGVFLYKESRITVVYIIRSEEKLDKRYFDLTPLLTVYFQPQKPEQGLVS